MELKLWHPDSCASVSFNDTILLPMSELTNTSRPGSTAYIDGPVSEPYEQPSRSNDDHEQCSSGSSVEEESESDNEQHVPQQAGGVEPELPEQRLDDFAYLDRRRLVSETDDASDESEWDVDDEDWELANGGKLRLIELCLG